jgi:hypothetical protein
VEWRWKGATKPGGNATRRPAEEWVRLPDGVTPAIVTPALWQAAQDAPRAHRGETTRNAARPYLLRGHIWCGVCGQRMHPMMENGTTASPRGIYRCSSRDTATGACGGKRVPAEQVEAWAWEHITNRLRHPDTLAAEVQRRAQEGPDAILTGDLETARRQYAQCERSQARLMRRYASGDEESDAALWSVTEREIKRLEANKGGYRRTIEQIEARLAAATVAHEQLTALRDYCARVDANLEHASFDKRRLALVALDIRVTGNGRDWTIHGDIPLDVPAHAEEVALAPTSSAHYARRLPQPPALA